MLASFVQALADRDRRNVRFSFYEQIESRSVIKHRMTSGPFVYLHHSYRSSL